MVRRFCILASTLAVSIGMSAGTQLVFGQDDPAKEPPAKSTDGATPPPAKPDPAPAETTVEPPNAVAGAPADPAQARALFETKFAEWKELLKQLRGMRHELQTADAEGRTELQKRWDSTIAETNLKIAEVTASGLGAYRAAPNEDRELTTFLAKVMADYVERDLYEEAVKVGNALVENQCDLPRIYYDTAVANFGIQNFEQTAKTLDQAEATNNLSPNSEGMRKDVEDYIELWKVEQEIRKKEAEADDLPRVKLTTTKGDIVVELFENEAPDTVGNFVSLVKNGFYEGLAFHRVISGFMAQGGCPEGDGTGGPGYSIYDEVDKPNARQHFRGVLSMAKRQEPHTGGSQFFFTFRPTAHLNGKHTVFGRIIEGMDVVTALQRIDPAAEKKPEPDAILKAEVLRDRGHEYLPKKVE